MYGQKAQNNCGQLVCCDYFRNDTKMNENESKKILLSSEINKAWSAQSGNEKGSKLRNLPVRVKQGNSGTEHASK